MTIAAWDVCAVVVLRAKALENTMTKTSRNQNRRRLKSRRKRPKLPPTDRLLRQFKSMIIALRPAEPARDQPELVPQEFTPYWRLIVLLEAHGFQRNAVKKGATAFDSTVHIFQHTAFGARGFLMVDVEHGSVRAAEYTKAAHYVQELQHSGRV